MKNEDDKLIDLRYEIELIHELLLLPAGYDIDIGGMLWVRRYEEPKWAVEWETGTGQTGVREFTDPKEAAEFFVAEKNRRKLGLDD